MDPLRSFLLVVTIAGALVTIYGLLDAYRDARRAFADAQARIDMMGTLDEAAEVEAAAIRAAYDATMPEELPERIEHNKRNSALQEQRYAVWDAIYERHDLRRITIGNLTFLAAYESKRLLGLVLDSTGRDLVIAAIGLAVSTVASAWSLFLP